MIAAQAKVYDIEINTELAKVYATRLNGMHRCRQA